MQDDLYFYLMLLGLVIAGMAWLIPNRSKKAQEEPEEINKLFYERQYRELLHLMSEMRQDADRRTNQLSREIEGLKKKLEDVQKESKGRFELPLQGHVQDAMGLNDRYAEIFDLYDQGKTTEEIASQMDMGTGEIELILQLKALSSRPGKPM